MAAVSKHSKVIDGITYTSDTFPASEGLEIGRRIARLIDGNAVGQALLTIEDTELAAVMTDASFMLSLIVGAANKSEHGDISSLAVDLLKYTTADKVRMAKEDGEPGEVPMVPGSVATHFDTHFAGRYQHMLEVCVWAARLGFGGP